MTVEIDKTPTYPKSLTVAELIKLLKQQPQNVCVYFENYEGWSEIANVRKDKIDEHECVIIG